MGHMDEWSERDSKASKQQYKDKMEKYKQLEQNKKEEFDGNKKMAAIEKVVTESRNKEEEVRFPTAPESLLSNYVQCFCRKVTKAGTRTV